MRFPEARNKRQLPIDQFPALATALYWPDQGFYRQANALRTLSSVSAVLLPGDGRRSFSTVPWPIDQLIFSHPASSSACGKWFCTPFSSVEPGVPNSKKHVRRRMAGFHPFFDIPSHSAPAANSFARCLPRQNRRISELKKARKRRMAGFLPFFFDIPSHPAPAANGFARCLPRQNRKFANSIQKPCAETASSAQGFYQCVPIRPQRCSGSFALTFNRAVESER